jgi:hypothetical protein
MELLNVHLLDILMPVIIMSIIEMKVPIYLMIIIKIISAIIFIYSVDVYINFSNLDGLLYTIFSIFSIYIQLLTIDLSIYWVLLSRSIYTQLPDTDHFLLNNQ